MLLDPGMDLTLRPMRYPGFYDRYRAAIRNTWTVEEVDLHSDLADLAKLDPGERHLINRLVAFFATGDSIVANNLVLNLYRHVNAPEARLYLSRQLFEEAVHVQFYLTLLDTYLPDHDERAKAFAAELAFARDLCGDGIGGMTAGRMREYLEYVADRRLTRLGLPIRYGTANPFAFMEFQDVQELANFFERRVSAYQVAVEGDVSFDEAF
jgi:ribonucleotide reductase beta subunit family protein with ferritin-like domain